RAALVDPPLAHPLEGDADDGLRGPRRALRAEAVPQPGGTAPDGRAVHPPRLRAAGRADRRDRRWSPRAPREEGAALLALRSPEPGDGRPRVGRLRLPVGFRDREVPAQDRARALAADDPQHVRGAGFPRLLLRAAAGRLPPASDPVPVSALERRLR